MLLESRDPNSCSSRPQPDLEHLVKYVGVPPKVPLYSLNSNASKLYQLLNVCTTSINSCNLQLTPLDWILQDTCYPIHNVKDAQHIFHSRENKHLLLHPIIHG